MKEISRRLLLKLIGGGGAAAAAGVAIKQWGKLMPYVTAPEEIRPGVWGVYATVCRECPAGCGMHVRHRDGRATKAEGNPGHPVNAGGLCARGQSALQGLYDPDRVTGPMRREREASRGEWSAVTWKEALEGIGKRLDAGNRGKVVVISDVQTGAMARVMERLAGAQEGVPATQSRSFAGKVLYYEAFNYEGLKTANERLFGRAVIPRYRIGQCRFVLSLGADFLETWISPVEFAREFAQMHTPGEDGTMGRMAYVGPRRSMTAANADDFVMVPPGGEGLVGMAMVEAIVRNGWGREKVEGLAEWLKPFEAGKVAGPAGVDAGKIVGMAKAFAEAESAVAIGGMGFTAESAEGKGGTKKGKAEEENWDLGAVAAGLLNWVTGRVGKSVDLGQPHALSRAATRREMAEALAGLGGDDVVVVHNTNPAYSLPGAAEALRRAGMVVVLGTMADETATMADWVLPIDSPLEAWGEYEPYEGVRGLQQPAMTRLWDTRAAGDLLIAMAGREGLTAENAESAEKGKDKEEEVGFEGLLRREWRQVHGRSGGPKEFEEFWREALVRGGVWEERGPVGPVALRRDVAAMKLGRIDWPPVRTQRPSEQMGTTAELWVYPSIMLFDGRTANRSWLQEAPEPVAYAAWGSWVEMSPEVAGRIRAKDGDMVELSGDGVAAVRAPVRVTADVAADTVAVATGQGHERMGRNANGKGVNAFMLAGGSRREGAVGRIDVGRTGGKGPIAYASGTQEQHGREILRWVDSSKVRAGEGPGAGEFRLPLPESSGANDLYPPRRYKQHRWAMVVDLQRCTGCGACAVACYAENNVQPVGPERLAKGAEMAWLKVVPYRAAGGGRVGFLPMMCQQCDAAPCEPVCPVYASVHNEEGLNAQVYNRCIGTRYCANNCPYKVRRFNWLNHEWARPLEMQLNPEVSVRERGVMEKCTFCVQRIREAQWAAKRQGRRVRDGEVAPACVQSCPAKAMVFGDLLDESSAVSRLTRHDVRRYHVLEKLNTRPAVTYLKRVRQREIGPA